jgi:hypothetical protein
VLVHGTSPPPGELLNLQEALSGPFDPGLAEAGQQVILVRRPKAGEQVQALAWRRSLRGVGAADPALRDFAEAWLGKGAPGSG